MHQIQKNEKAMANKELIDDFMQSEGLLYQLAETIQQ